MEDIIDQEIQNTNQHRTPIDLEGAGGTLTTGILSIVLMGIIGLILALVTISGANKSIEKYQNDPGKYTVSSYKKVNAGRTCAYVSLSIMGAILLIVLITVLLN